MSRAALGIAISMLVAACAKMPVVEVPARNDLYILLPGADGSVGSLVVTHGDQQRVLATPHAAARIGKPGAVETATTTEAEMRGVFEGALGAQPPRPTSFLLYFLHDSEEFTPETRVVVEDVLRDIARRPAPEVVVIGHTDTMGADDYNDRLSVQRAERIRGRLVELGIAAERIQAAGRGKRELLVPSADQVSEPKNRRVEIVVR